MQIRRIAYALGAEVTGIDLGAPLHDADLSTLRAAWLEHLLLRFPNQHLDAATLGAFARRLGELEKPPAHPHPDEPLVGILSSRASDNIARRRYEDVPNWHSDQSFTLHPTAFTLLYCRSLPSIGGDTIFANTYAAYESLSPKMREVVDGLSAIHDLPQIRKNTAEARYAHATVHPIARVHPDTGRKALYLGYRARRILGMTEEEGTPILEFLKAHAVRYEFTYRHRWSVDDVVVWDDRCTLHLALRDFDLEEGAERQMMRCAVAGARSGEPYLEAALASA
jgi:taurine dioxygenase